MIEINDKVYEKAIKLLSIRLHTTGELHAKLKQRGFADGEIREVLRKLEDLKFLDDKQFAEIFVDNLKRYKDFGYFGMKAKLLARKIPTEIAENALTKFFTLEDEFEVAKKLVAKLRRQGRTEFDKLARSLAGKGFRTEIVREVLK